MFNFVYKSIKTSCIVFLSLLAISTSAYANLIVNEGFEDDIFIATGPTVGNWGGFRSSIEAGFSNSTAMPLSGQRSLELSIRDTSNAFAGVFQDISGLLAGSEVLFSGWHKKTSDNVDFEVRIEFMDSVNGFVEVGRTANLSGDLSFDYSLFEIDGIIPDGADTARLVYAVQSFSVVTNQQALVDDTYFSVVSFPNKVNSPSIVLIILLAGAFLAYRRK